MRAIKEVDNVMAMTNWFINPFRAPILEAMNELQELAERSDETAKTFSMNCGKYSRECLESAALAEAYRKSIEVLNKHLEVKQ